VNFINSRQKIVVSVILVIVTTLVLSLILSEKSSPQGLPTAILASDDIFYIHIGVQDIQELHGAQIEITYNPSVAQLASVAAGNFLSSDGAQVYFSEDLITGQSGRVTGMYLVRLNDTGISGSGNIISVAFIITGTNHEIALSNILLANSQAQALPLSAVRVQTEFIEGTSDNPEIVPLVSNLAPSGTLPRGTTETTLSASTNIPAECRYSQTSGLSISQMIRFSSTQSIQHYQAVSGLSNGNSYTYYVMCQDMVSGGVSPEYTISFTIQQSPPGQLRRQQRTTTFSQGREVALQILSPLLSRSNETSQPQSQLTSMIINSMVIVFMVSLLAVITLLRRRP